MCNYQTQLFCSCCKKRLRQRLHIGFEVIDDIEKADCSCTYASITIIADRKCLACKEECIRDCDPGDLPTQIYYMPNLNKCYMLFEAIYDDDLYINYNIYYMNRCPFTVEHP